MKGATLRVYPGGEARASGLYQADLPAGMDFPKIAEAAGGYGERLADPAGTPAAIARCMAEVRNGRSALLHILVTKL